MLKSWIIDVRRGFLKKKLMKWNRGPSKVGKKAFVANNEEKH